MLTASRLILNFKINWSQKTGQCLANAHKFLNVSDDKGVLTIFYFNAFSNKDSGNTKEGSITVPLTFCLTGLESAVWQLAIFVFICKTD